MCVFCIFSVCVFFFFALLLFCFIVCSFFVFVVFFWCACVRFCISSVFVEEKRVFLLVFGL